MPEQTVDSAKGRLGTIARSVVGSVDTIRVERELNREADRLLRADRPEPDFSTPVAMEMYTPDTSGPQLVIAPVPVASGAQAEAQTPEPSSLPESPAPRQGFSLRRMFAAAIGRK
jgi:hypothetical protein